VRSGNIRLLPRLILWCVLAAAVVTSGWTIIQTAATWIVEGIFFWDAKSAYFLWWELPHPWLVAVLALVSVGLATLAWPAPTRRTQSHTTLRIVLWVVALLIASISVVGLVRGGSGLASILRGDFELTRAPMSILWFEIDSVRLFWVGLVSAVYVFIVYLGVAYRAHVRHAGRGTWVGVSRVAFDSKRAMDSIATFRIDKWQREFFIDLMTDAARRVDRIRETVEPRTRSTIVRTQYSLDLRGSRKKFRPPGSERAGERAKRRRRGFVTVPIFATTRGQLEDRLRIWVGVDKTVETLPSVEAVAYTAAVVRSGINAAGPEALDAYLKQQPGLEPQIVGFLGRSGVIAQMSREEQSADALVFARLLAAILRLPHRDESALYRVVLLLSVLYQSYPFIVTIPAAEIVDMSGIHSATVTVERRTTPSLALSSVDALWRDIRSWWRRDRKAAILRLGRFGRGKLMDQVRLFFGVRSNRLAHSLGNATRARSYHLEVAGQEHTYLARQTIENIKGWEEDVELLDRIQAQASPAVGQRHSHLYIRGGERFLGRFRYSVAFFERTPGSMAVAFVAAASSLFLSLVVAIQETVLSDARLADAADPPAPQSGDLFQILFAFPIVAAASGALRPDRSQWGGVLSARIANLVTIVVSLTAVWVSYLGFGIEGEVRPRVWLFLILALAVVAASCLGSWIMRVRIHSRFIDPIVEDDLDAIAGTYSPVTAGPPGWAEKAAVRSSQNVPDASELLNSALEESRLGPSVWVVPELWQSRPWVVPEDFLATIADWDEIKVAINLGILTIDVLPPGRRVAYAQTAYRRVPEGTASDVLAKVISALEADAATRAHGAEGH
jgi:hypothetical protein